MRPPDGRAHGVPARSGFTVIGAAVGRIHALWPSRGRPSSHRNRRRAELPLFDPAVIDDRHLHIAVLVRLRPDGVRYLPGASSTFSGVSSVVDRVMVGDPLHHIAGWHRRCGSPCGHNSWNLHPTPLGFLGGGEDREVSHGNAGMLAGLRRPYRRESIRRAPWHDPAGRKKLRSRNIPASLGSVGDGVRPASLRELKQTRAVPARPWHLEHSQRLMALMWVSFAFVSLFFI